MYRIDRDPGKRSQGMRNILADRAPQHSASKLEKGMKRTIGFVSIALVAALTTACGQKDGASTAGTNADPSAVAASTAEARASASAAKADGGILDVCALVTQADAEGIMGVPAKISGRQNDEHSSVCSYVAVDQTNGNNLLSVKIHPDEDANEAKSHLEVRRKMYANDSAGNAYVYEALSGIGGDAFMASTKLPDGMPAEMADGLPGQQLLFAVKGAKDIDIMTSYSGKRRTADPLKALAKKLADHI